MCVYIYTHTCIHNTFKVRCPPYLLHRHAVIHALSNAAPTLDRACRTSAHMKVRFLATSLLGLGFRVLGPIIGESLWPPSTYMANSPRTAGQEHALTMTS